MQLYILDKDPIKSADMIPDKYKFKMLIELGQLICSAGLSDVYKSMPQGRELQSWVWLYRPYIYQYYDALDKWSMANIKMKEETISKIVKIKKDLFNCVYEFKYIEPEFAYFRYSANYKCDIPSKTLLPIDECIKEYKKYLEWKLLTK